MENSEKQFLILHQFAASFEKILLIPPHRRRHECSEEVVS